MMTFKEFKKRVKHNTKILKSALKNDVCLTSIARDLYTWTSKPGELHFCVLGRNLTDIIPSLYIGSLANISTNGVDNYIVHPDGIVENIEVKQSEIASTTVWQGPQGGLAMSITAHKTSRINLKSRISGSYTFRTPENLLSKNMRTILCIADTDNLITKNTYVDLWELNGNIVVEYLQRSKNQKRDIKLSTFIKHGSQTKTTVPLVGFEKFEEKLQEVAPSKQQWLKDNKGI